jgi:ActR/RegA family two-component response regulator
MARYCEAAYSHAVGRRLIAFVASSASSDTLDRLFDAGGYDVMLIDSMDDAYTQIKGAMPQLVIVCMQPDEETIGCQVLSMLGTDRETARIPVLTHFVEADRQTIAGPSAEAARFERRTLSLSMN